MVKNNDLPKWAGRITESILQGAINEDFQRPEVFVAINEEYDGLKVTFRIRKINQKDEDDWYFINIRHDLTPDIMPRIEDIDGLVGYLTASMMNEMRGVLEEEIRKEQGV